MCVCVCVRAERTQSNDRKRKKQTRWEVLYTLHTFSAFLSHTAEETLSVYLQISPAWAPLTGCLMGGISYNVVLWNAPYVCNKELKQRTMFAWKHQQFHGVEEGRGGILFVLSGLKSNNLEEDRWSYSPRAPLLSDQHFLFFIAWKQTSVILFYYHLTGFYFQEALPAEFTHLHHSSYFQSCSPANFIVLNPLNA